MKSFITAIALFLVAVSNAQTAPGTISKEPVATVKCVGIQEDMIVFNVSYPNPEAGKFSLTVKDQDGAQLYQSVFTEKDFYKQFRLPKMDKSKISFVIRNGKEAELVRSFEINVSSRFVEDIAIKKIN